METETLIEVSKNPLISAVVACIVAAVITQFVPNRAAKNEIKYANVKRQTIEMNSAVKSLADNLNAMMQVVGYVAFKEYGLDRTQQDKFDSLSHEIYGIVQKTNLLARIMENIRELERIRFDDFLKEYNQDAYQFYYEYKINLFGDILDEENKIGLTHKMLWGKNIAGRSFYDVLMEIDMKIIQRYFEEQW